MAARCTWLAEGRSSIFPLPKDIPSSVMDMSFANQRFPPNICAPTTKTSKPQVYVVPEHLGQGNRRLKSNHGPQARQAHPEQEHYLAPWQEGT